MTLSHHDPSPIMTPLSSWPISHHDTCWPMRSLLSPHYLWLQVAAYTPTMDYDTLTEPAYRTGKSLLDRPIVNTMGSWSILYLPRARVFSHHKMALDLLNPICWWQNTRAQLASRAAPSRVWIVQLIIGAQRDSPTRFSTFSFFHHSNQPGPLTNGLKYFRFWLRFRWDIRIFMNLRAVSYCAESVCPRYDTAQGPSLCSVILRRVNIPAVWYCAEIVKICGEIFAQYDTAGVSLRALSYCQQPFLKTFAHSFKGKVSQIENILTHWSVGQSGSNDEKKTEGRKSRWTVPLRLQSTSFFAILY